MVSVAIDSEEAQCFLISARCGCFAQAARRLNLKTAMLRKTLSLLEARVGSALFVQQGNVVALSQVGRQLQAQLGTQARLSSPSSHADPAVSTAGRQPMVRLAVAEPLLSDLLSRGLIDYLRKNAGARLEITSFNNDVLLPTLDAEVVVWLGGPEEMAFLPDIALTGPVKLACLSYLPHIAKRYSRESIRPNNLSSLDDYMLVQLAHDQNVAELEPWNNEINQRLAALTYVHAYELSCKLIRCGACVGLLPAYMSRIDRSLAALPDLFSEKMQRNVWLTVHPHVADKADVQLIVELILDAFHERREWF